MAIDDRCKLFVAGLPDSISEAVLRQLFEATGGSVVDVSVPRDRATGRPRGFGFVTLSSEQEASAARESLDGSMQSGRSISVRAFQAGPPKRPDGVGRDGPPGGGGAGGGGGGGGGASEDRTLYLGNLPYDTTSTDVEQMLERAGVSAVVRVNLPLDPEGRPRGFGFVTLGSAEDAQLAVDALREADLKGRRVSASIAHARGTRPAGGPGGPGMGGGPGGGGFSPRPPPRDAPNWGPSDRGPDPSMGGGPPPEDGGDDRGKKSGPKDKKKKGTRGPERGRARREGEGLRSPRGRGGYKDDD